jgi:hypothetical protein
MEKLFSQKGQNPRTSTWMKHQKDVPRQPWQFFLKTDATHRLAHDAP